jgi:4'-phosphopantetheinyl transferase
VIRAGGGAEIIDRMPAAALTSLVDLTVGEDVVVRAAALLTPAERARAERGTAAVRRRRILLRAHLRELLAAELAARPDEVPLGTTPAGRPELAAEAGGRLEVSCSASGTVGLVAVVRDAQVGVDVETVAPWADEVLDEGWLAEAERTALAALPPHRRGHAATRAWTQKEAVLKGRGTGLLGNPCAVVTPIGRTACVIDGWQLREVAVPRGFVATVAVRDRGEPAA